MLYNKAFKIGLLGILLSLAPMLSGTAALAKAGRASETVQQHRARVGITAVIDKVIANMTRGTNGKELANTMFTNDALISVAGDKTYHGKAQWSGLLDEWMKPPFVCKWWIEEPIRISRDGDIGAVNVMERCPGEIAGHPPYFFRMIYVFIRTPRGWKSSQLTVLGPAGENL